MFVANILLQQCMTTTQMYNVDAKLAQWGFSSGAGCVLAINLVWHEYTR